MVTYVHGRLGNVVPEKGRECECWVAATVLCTGIPTLFSVGGALPSSSLRRPSLTLETCHTPNEDEDPASEGEGERSHSPEPPLSQLRSMKPRPTMLGS